MKDLFGNRIAKGSLVYWKSKDVAAVCADANDGGLSLGESNRKTPPTITLQITIPINLERGVSAAEAVLSDFLCIVNPAATAAVEGMLTQ